ILYLSTLLFVQGLAAFAADASAPGMAPGELIHVMADPGGLIAPRTYNHDVGSGDGAFPLGDAAFDLAAGVGPSVPLDHSDMFDQDAPRFPIDPQHSAAFALIAAGNHADRIFLFQLNPVGR